MEKNLSVPILMPFEPEDFWAQISVIIREEICRNQKEPTFQTAATETPGLTEKPMYKITEICFIFKTTKPTIYDWINDRY